MDRPNLLSPEFRALSARLGKDPLQVQGPGGNTSIKDGKVMFIKASGTELADAEEKDIFVPVDCEAAVLEAFEKAGDGSCKTTVLDPNLNLRPSIETTFHAALHHNVVAHTHSVSTIVHAISPQGRVVAAEKLEGLPFVMVPYAKPGLPLTRKILARITPETKVIILQNHGLICAGKSVEEVSDLIAEVENRLRLDPTVRETRPATAPAPSGFDWSEHGWIAQEPRAFALAKTGTYYPDHVVFLGPCLPTANNDTNPPAIMEEDQGIVIKSDATPSQRAMLLCLSDVLSRLPADWSADPIGSDAEAELLDWDAEKYRQALAARA